MLHNPPHPLSSEELSQLLTAKPGYSLHGGRRATAGLGLRGAFAVSDVPQVMLLFDWEWSVTRKHSNHHQRMNFLWDD